MLSNTIHRADSKADRVPRAGLIDRLARRAVHAALDRLCIGATEIRERDCHQAFGDPAAPSDQRAQVTIRDPRVYRAIAWSGLLGAGEAYTDGWWNCDDLTTLMRIFLQNEAVFDSLNSGFSRASSFAGRCLHALRRNTRRGSRRNIAAHYDLSNEFYRLFLDDTMTYSCGIFEHDGSSLREASVAKLDRICRKLRLSPDDHVIEIGSGWGSFAIHAAKTYGCRVTTTTISEQQHAFARRRISEAGMDGRVTLLRKDYRDLTGQYDKLVSIEMIEAVGWQYYDTFFRQCSRLLKPNGVACLQAIVMADRYYENCRNAVDFIKRHIFPGSCIPSIGAMTCSIARSTDLGVAHLEDITPHYARTLRAWTERFRSNLPGIRDLCFSESFIRMWEYYLCYCEAGFLERTIGAVQMLMVKPNYRGTPPLGILSREGLA